MFILNQTLNPVFLKLGPITIYWYAVLIVTGIILGLYVATKESVRLGLHKETFSDLIVFALPIAIISARLYYVLFEWDQYINRPWWAPFAVWEGGIAIHGALIGSVTFAYFFAKKRKIPFYKLADIAAPGLLIGQAVGRWGNFMNQEAHGGPVSQAAYDLFSQYLPPFIENQMTIDGVLYHPTFLYESLWNVFILIIILVLRRKSPLRGDVFLTYIVGYSIGRFFIEGMRTDSLYVVGQLRTAQLISVLLIILGLVLMYLNRKKSLVTVYYDGKKKR